MCMSYCRDSDRAGEWRMLPPANLPICPPANWPIDAAQAQPKASCWIWTEPLLVHEPSVLEPIGDSTPTDQPSDELRRELISPSAEIKRESRLPSCTTSVTVGKQRLPQEVAAEPKCGSNSVQQVIDDALFDAELQRLGQWDDGKAGWIGGWEAHM